MDGLNCKNGVSSCEIARTVRFTQKSAWFLLHRIRLALHDDSTGKLDGEVEVDETFIGGKARNMHIDKRERRITGTGGKERPSFLARCSVAARFALPWFPTAKRTGFRHR